MFDDFNKKINALKTHRRLKQIKTNKEFHIFFCEISAFSEEFENLRRSNSFEKSQR